MCNLDLGLGEVLFSAGFTIDGNKKINTYSKTVFQNNTDFRLIYKDSVLYDEITFLKNSTGYSVKRVAKNLSEKILKLNELNVIISNLEFGGVKKDNYFYSIENPRIYESFTFPLDYKRTENDALNSEFDVHANNRWADPGVINERINYSPYQPFPAILLSNYKTDIGFVHGTLSQKIFFHNYIVKNQPTGAVIEVFSSFKDISYREFNPQETLIDQWYIGKTTDAANLDKIFYGYTQELRKVLPINYGASNINRDNLVWGSWNDGIYRNVSHEIIIDEVKALIKHFPTVKWLQLDDGYAVFNKEENSTLAHGLGTVYEENQGIDNQKFPYELKGLTDEIKNYGLRPAIWIGGLCPKASKIYKDNPEWFIDYSKRLNKSSPLDISQKQARDYMLRALDVLITDNGFEGVKHDFWSYAFEDSNDLLKNKDKSGYEYRSQWCSEIRKRLPADGYFQTGCDIVLANPFLGEYFTNYRYGIDVGSGNWDYIRTCVLWGTACFATHTGDLFVPNSDSIGLLPDLNKTDFMFWVNFVMISHSMVELSGLFSKANFDKERFEVLKKATCNINNGQDVYLVNFDYRKKSVITPSIMYNITPHFSTQQDCKVLPHRTVAIFNIDESEKEIAFNLNDLGLEGGKYILTDVWTGKTEAVTKKYRVSLNPHESRLISLIPFKKNVILDSNIKINVLKNTATSITISVFYKANAKLKVYGSVSKVAFNSKLINYHIKDNELSFDIEEKGTLKIFFK